MGEHKIALLPGVTVLQHYFDPAKDPGLRHEAGAVVEIPKLKEFQSVVIRAQRLRTDEHSGEVVIKGGEVLS